MAGTNTIQNAENLRGIFHKIMQRYQLNYQDIRMEEMRHKQNISDKGQFDCEHCPYTWSSNFSWITFDLSEMKISYRWRMKCRYCKTMLHPRFTIEQLEVMYEKAVRLYKGLPPTEKNHHVIRRGLWNDRPQPHMPILCEKCGWGITICWQSR